MSMSAARRTVHGVGHPGDVSGCPTSGAVPRRSTSPAPGGAPVTPVYDLPLRFTPRLTAERLWNACRALDSWESAVDEELGETLGEILLLLWSVHRLGVISEGQAALDELVDDELHPTFGNSVLLDIVGVSFALGAAWADQRRSFSPDLDGKLVRLR